MDLIGPNRARQVYEDMSNWGQFWDVGSPFSNDEE